MKPFFVAFAVLAAVLGESHSFGGVPYAPGQGPSEDLRVVAEKITAAHAANNFLPSLEAREHADFLLTPALIVQALLPKEPVQFDATITLKAPIAQSHVTLFARYWVASNAYSIGIVWAEPNGRFLNFPAYPPGLEIFSSENTFSINHNLFTNFNASFKKPLSVQNVFTNQYGDYPISSIRFAEKVSNNPIVFAAQNLVRDTDGVEVGRANVSEQKIRLGLSGKGARVRLRETYYDVREFPATDLRGGRAIEIEWMREKIGLETALFPRLVTVASTNGATLEKAELSGFFVVGIREPGFEAVCEQYAGFDARDLEYRDLVDQYWKKPGQEVRDHDRARARSLIYQYSSGALGTTVGKELKRLNVLMELNRMIEDDNALLARYREYLECLEHHGLVETLLVGGQTAIDTLMIWQRPEQAKRMIEVWIEHARRIEKPDVVIDFARQELKKRNFVTTVQLLDRYNPEFISPDARARLAKIRTEAEDELRRFVESAPNDGMDEISAGQISLARRCL